MVMQPTRLTPLDELLWERASSGGEPLSLEDAIVASYGDRSPDQLTVWTLSSDENPADRLLGAPGERWGLGESLGPTRLLWIPDERGTYVIGVWPTLTSGVYHLVSTVPVTDRRWRGLQRWVGRNSPWMFAPYLTEHEFEGIVSSLASVGEIEVSRLTARTHGIYSSYTRGWRSGRDQRRPSHVEVLSEIRGFASPRSLTLDVLGHLSIHLRRDSGATLYGGADFAAFERVVLGGFQQAARSRRVLLGDRQREVDQEPQSIRIKLAADAFDEPDVLTSLVDSLSLPHSSVAVLHRNPYIHLALTNYVDGSNADAFVFNSDELVIYPGFAASTGALAKLAAAITERFAGVEVTEGSPPQPPTLEELLTTG